MIFIEWLSFYDEIQYFLCLFDMRLSYEKLNKQIYCQICCLLFFIYLSLASYFDVCYFSLFPSFWSDKMFCCQGLRGFQLVFVLLCAWIIFLYYDLFDLWHTIHMSTEILNSKIYLTLDVTLLCCRYWMIHHQYQRNMSMCIRRSSALSSVLACRKMLMQGQHASRYIEVLFHT